MTEARWRVVVVSQVAPVAAGFAQLIRDLGHEPVAHFAIRRRSLDEEPPPVVQTFLPRLLWEGPKDVPLVFPATRRQLTDLLRRLEPDLVVCFAFPWLIPAEALAVPPLGWVNCHPSLLPSYRGPTPVSWAIRNGETEIGVTFHRMDGSFDTGAILAQGRVPLADDETFDSLNAKAAPLTGELLVTALERIARGELGEPQEGGDYQSLFEDEYAYIDTRQPRIDVHRQVRAWAFTPFAVGERGAILERNGARRRVLRTSLVKVDGAERIDCADGPLWVLETEPV
jgi:methionyl-tRNA formyltransferase